jgi:hypothetical protein
MSASCPQSMCCVSYGSQTNVEFSTTVITRLDFVAETKCVSYEVRTQFSYIRKNFISFPFSILYSLAAIYSSLCIFVSWFVFLCFACLFSWCYFGWYVYLCICDMYIVLLCCIVIVILPQDKNPFAVSNKSESKYYFQWIEPWKA